MKKTKTFELRRETCLNRKLKTYENGAAISVHVGSALAATSVHGAFPSGRDEDVVHLTAVFARSVLADLATSTLTEMTQLTRCLTGLEGV